MSEELPPFSDDETICTKCRGNGASTEYRAIGECVHNSGPEIRIGWRPNERLHRECLRCGYQWDEALATEGSEQAIGLQDEIKYRYGNLR